MKELVSRPPARTRGLKQSIAEETILLTRVASSREDAWIETAACRCRSRGSESRPPARTRGLKHALGITPFEVISRVLPRGRVD